MTANFVLPRDPAGASLIRGSIAGSLGMIGVVMVWLATLLYVKIGEPDDGRYITVVPGPLRALTALSAVLLPQRALPTLATRGHLKLCELIEVLKDLPHFGGCQ